MTFFVILLAACGLVSDGAWNASASCADEAAHLQMDGKTKEDLHPRTRGHRDRIRGH